MGGFDEAVRQMREAALQCAHCRAVNIPHAKPTIDLDVHHQAACNQCGHSWTLDRIGLTRIPGEQ